MANLWLSSCCKTDSQHALPAIGDFVFLQPRVSQLLVSTGHVFRLSLVCCTGDVDIVRVFGCQVFAPLGYLQIRNSGDLEFDKLLSISPCM